MDNYCNMSNFNGNYEEYTTNNGHNNYSMNNNCYSDSNFENAFQQLHLNESNSSDYMKKNNLPVKNELIHNESNSSTQSQQISSNSFNNYYYYKLFDDFGQENFSAYQNKGRVQLFIENESEKKKYDHVSSIEENMNVPLSNTNILNNTGENYFGPQKSKIVTTKERNFKPY